MDSNFKRNLLISFGTSLTILLISSTASYISIRNLVDSNRLVNNTQDVIHNINEASSLMVDAQTSMRGFLITGREDFLEQYADADNLVDTHFGKLEKLLEDDPIQQRNIDAINPLKDRFFSYLQRRISEKRRNVPILAEELETGRRLMDDMRLIFKRMERDQQLILAERSAESEKFGFYSTLLIIIAAIIATFMSVVFFMRILSDFSKRTALQRALEIKDIETAERIRVISGIAEQIAKGDYEIRAIQVEADALGSVGDSLNNMASALGTSFKSLSEKEWLQAGIAQLNQVMIREKSVTELATDVVEYLAVYTGSNAGVLYMPDGDELVATAGYSFVPSADRQRIKIGQGLTGQAFASGEIMELKAISADDIKISYALGEIKPAHIVALPLIEDKIAGVVELARIQEYTARETDFLRAVSSNIAIAMTAAQNRKRVHELLEETEAQSNELKTQHSELEMMNAELETQTEKLQASEEELRVQQEELQQTNEELAERSVLLEEKNLEIQKKSEDLELTTRYKSEFLANMSHELRTPLNSILLLSRLLSENNDSNLSEEQIEFAKVIQSSGDGLLGLIDEILDLSKIEAGKMELELLDVPTSEIAENMQSLFHEVARQKNITFNINSDNAPMVLKTDRMRLEQILKNLISNAIKFTSVGSVTLDIKQHPTNSNTFCFIVTDTGIGIPDDQQPLIFEAFKQADGSTKRKYGGTGLGLSISRELAKLLKGEISLKSAENQGSEFTLCIPIAASQAAKAYDSTFEAIGQKAPSNELKDSYITSYIPEAIPDDREDLHPSDKVILIIEDDMNFAKSLLDFTRKRSYKGIVCVRGDQALEYALKYKPIGILLDIQLPVKSGLDVIEELKGNSQTRPIPVHMMSSLKMKRESLLRGAVNFLDKPIAFEQMPEVFKKIEHIVNRKAQKVLIIEDNLQHAKALEYFLESSEISSEVQSNIDEGIAALQKPDVDCVILDMGIPDQQAYNILENVKKNPGLENLPIIVFTGKSLSMKEETKIKKYADSIVVKTAHSYQRMLDEVSLFMHLVEENKRTDQLSVGKKKHPMHDILNGKTVLVVDDDVRNIYSLTKALEALQMNVITAIDGREALTALSENPKTDVVLLDMMMPNMDGYETASRIRQNNKYKNLPVIAVTAKAMTGDREKCINAGASDYITKPVDIDQLLSLLRVWLYDRI